ncbi:putative DNA-directed DNA polymerase [Senna tora]|uniref:Putative DNA-directed DNA polymerase n=1 Tax=Senna tora TaxID=362788 RepID=A0A834T5F8_9FABA|nr:putative DNA-directed DNA polymerase [Senna tora]
MILCSSESNREHPTSLEWKKPASNFVKINVDAALKKDGGGVLGGLIRDEHSRCLGVFRNSVGYPNDPTKLEAMAVKQGLELALKVGCNKVIVEGDALLVMEMLKTPCDQASSLNALCRDVLRFCHNFQDVIFNWVPRTCNDVVDLICRTDKVVQANVVWTDSVPFYLSEASSEQTSIGESHCSTCSATSGSGVQCFIDGKRILVGNRKLMVEIKCH